MKEAWLSFLWVVDFPLFEGVDEEGNPQPAHHPFTMPHEEDIEKLEEGDLLGVRSQAYDLVLNGWELGSGSVRIHKREIQEKIFQVLGIETEVWFLIGCLPLRSSPACRFCIWHGSPHSNSCR